MKQLTLEEELDFIFEELIGLTKRSSLETGFNHTTETFRELQDRLLTIQGYCKEQRKQLPALIAKHVNYVPDPKHITLTEFE